MTYESISRYLLSRYQGVPPETTTIALIVPLTLNNAHCTHRTSNERTGWRETDGRGKQLVNTSPCPPDSKLARGGGGCGRGATHQTHRQL
eukprot:9472885-Pyramimonas_sp.AAC.1